MQRAEHWLTFRIVSGFVNFSSKLSFTGYGSLLHATMLPTLWRGRIKCVSLPFSFFTLGTSAENKFHSFTFDSDSFTYTSRLRFRFEKKVAESRDWTLSLTCERGWK